MILVLELDTMGLIFDSLYDCFFDFAVWVLGSLCKLLLLNTSQGYFTLTVHIRCRCVWGALR